MNKNIAHSDGIRSRCQGIVPLDASLQPWMEKVLAGPHIHDWVRHYGSPLNIVQTDPLRKNIAALNGVANEANIDFRVYFARKANKCISLAKAANEVGAGIDVASKQELEQVLEQRISGRDLICTAAIKDDDLIATCVKNHVTIAIDNTDELQQLAHQLDILRLPAEIALRLSGFEFNDTRLDSRFGIDLRQLDAFLSHCQPMLAHLLLRMRGIHFHLDGYSAAQRVAAIKQCLPVIDTLREVGHPIEFLDMGGGIPMSYLEDETQWHSFWDRLQQAILKQIDPITYKNHGLGLIEVERELYGSRKCYPYFQTCVQGDWLQEVLSAKVGDHSLADAIHKRDLQLRCEPGRSVLDGAGMTVAKVVFRKQRPNGDWFIGLKMNSTQCRTSSDEFLVDPILVPRPDASREEAMDGYLVGAYCTESELISLRKFRFSAGVQVGDLVAIPNTAGYFMHFRESRSHQFPLARNILVTSLDPLETVDDPIDF